MRALAGMSSSRNARRPARSHALAPLVAALLAGASPAVAQPTAECSQGRIDFVFVDPQSIFDADDPALDSRVRWAYGAANALHVRTRPRTVQRELLFGPGDCYDPFLLSESERLLRGFGTFASVDVFGVPQPDGDWHVVVATRDEWSTQLDVKFRFDNRFSVEGVRLFETNLLGTARTFGVYYFEHEVTEEHGVFYRTPHFLRTRWDASGSVGRTRAGSFVRSEFAYPFLGEVSHTAGRVAFRRDDTFFDYIVADDPELGAPHVLLPVRDKFADASLVRRFGDRGRTVLLGAAMSLEQVDYPGVVQIAPNGNFDDRMDADSAEAAPVLPQRTDRDAVRLSLLLGHQNVVWRKRRGFDTMRGEQDVRYGTELGLILGRTVSARGGRHDLLLGGTAYGGWQALGGLVALRAQADGRRGVGSADDTGWHDVIADAELLGYFRRITLPNHTFVFRAATTSAWSTRTPLQLTLGGERALRGYDPERFPGGRRLVFSVEDRIYLGWPWRDLFDTGLTLFADVGRIWPGDVPFGADSGWRTTAGFGIRSSFPAGGRTTYRLDFAWPVERGVSLGDLRVRVSVGEILGLVQREADPQWARSRAETIGGRLFDVRNR